MKANNLAEETLASMKFTNRGASAPRTPAKPIGSGPSPLLPSRWDLVGRRPELGREQLRQGVKRFGAVFPSMGSRPSQGPDRQAGRPGRGRGHQQHTHDDE